MAAGTARTFGVRSTDFALARYDAHGALDSSFGASGIVTTDFAGDPYGGSDGANALAVQPDGKLVAAGTALTRSGLVDIALARFLP